MDEENTMKNYISPPKFRRWIGLKKVLAALLLALPILAGCGGEDASTANVEGVSTDGDVSETAGGDDLAGDPMPGSAETPATTESSTVKAKLLREQKFEAKFPTGEVRVAWTARLYSDNTKRKHGTYIEYYRNGQEYIRGEYDEHKKHGKWTYFNSDGKVAKEGSYVAGLLDDLWVYYRKDGTKKNEKAYKNGDAHGEWPDYGPDGETLMREVVFVDGKRHGMAREWHENGQLALEIGFVNGNIDGQRLQWFSDGSQRSEENFQNGKRHGKATAWTRNGEVVSQVTYENDKRVASK